MRDRWVHGANGEEMSLSQAKTDELASREAAQRHETSVIPNWGNTEFFACCACGDKGPRRPTREAAAQDARRHGVLV